MATKKSSDPLVGKFFHSYTADRKLCWQGYVLKRVPGTDLYLVKLFEWLSGFPSNMEVVKVDTMVGWSFYNSEAAWNQAATERMRQERHTK
jgi:hypothetical protein